MKQQATVRKPIIWLVTLALFAGALFMGFSAFTGSSAFAQSAEFDDDDDDMNEAPDVPITGEALGLATAAALDYLGEGTVTEAEMGDGDDEGFYEVEVMMDNGSEVEVHLDEQFNVLSHELDD